MTDERFAGNALAPSRAPSTPDARLVTNAVAGSP
jgi:hypothetical protein